MNDDLPTALLKARDHVRDVLRPQYVEIGPAGALALMLTIDPALQRAEVALKEHDATEMLRALTELKNIK